MTISKPIAITMGDAAGIGPEIIAKCHADPSVSHPIIVVGDVASMRRAARIVDVNVKVQQIEKLNDYTNEPGNLCVLAASNLPEDLPFGCVDARAGRAAYDYVETAVHLALNGDVLAIVTAPINKEALKAAGCQFPGHTEILADLTDTTDYAMMLFNQELRVLLVTIHVSLSSVCDYLTIERELRAIRLAAKGAQQLGISSPRVAVAGLNPHAGEGRLFGNEDQDIIAPAVAEARREGIDASGPWPGDTVFMQARQGRYDIVVAQYHDQGLIPVKYLGVENGVNATVGLPFIRTSVDHGTAFDIAGQGIADHASLLVAIEQALAMSVHLKDTGIRVTRRKENR